MPFSIKKSLAADVFPHTSVIPFDDQSLTIHYRDLPDDWVTLAEETVGEDVAALGFPVRPWIYSAVSQDVLFGEEAIAIVEATEVLDQAGREKRSALVREARGAVIRLVVGSWDADEPLSQESCASLPESLQKTILLLADNATLSLQKKTR